MKKILATILAIIMTVSTMGITTVFADDSIVEINHSTYQAQYGFEHDFSTIPDNESEIEITFTVLNENPIRLKLYINEESVLDKKIEGNSEFKYSIKNDKQYNFHIDVSDYRQLGYEVHCSINADKISKLSTNNPLTLNTFSDINGHWAEQAINKIANEGIISGYPDRTFKPDAPITRAEFAKIATLAFNLEPSNTKQYYADLDGSEWFYTYAQAIGFMPNYLLPDKEHPNMKPYIYDGYNANFLPNENAVRMHIAEVLSGIYVNIAPVSYSNDIHKLTQEVLATFNDDCYKNLSLASENADKMIKFTWIANNLGIMQGDDNGNFNPYGYVTRAELVTMIDRMLSATDNSNLLKHNKTINLNPNSSTQLEELIVENGYGYWTFDIHNNSESPVKILITKDTPTGEQIGDLVRAWQKENKTIDCGGIPLADGVYYLSITTNGEHYFDGSIDISLSNQAN